MFKQALVLNLKVSNQMRINLILSWKMTQTPKNKQTTLKARMHWNKRILHQPLLILYLLLLLHIHSLF